MKPVTCTAVVLLMSGLFLFTTPRYAQSHDYTEWINGLQLVGNVKDIKAYLGAWYSYIIQFNYCNGERTRTTSYSCMVNSSGHGLGFWHGDCTLVFDPQTPQTATCEGHTISFGSDKFLSPEHQHGELGLQRKVIEEAVAKIPITVK
jgi:hypothetical protein